MHDTGAKVAQKDSSGSGISLYIHTKATDTVAVA